jgi:hypothetical protein
VARVGAALWHRQVLGLPAVDGAPQRSDTRHARGGRVTAVSEQHVSGWHVELGNLIVSSDPRAMRQILATVNADVEGWQARAHLIAAAPEMYDALRSLLNAYALLAVQHQRPEYAEADTPRYGARSHFQSGGARLMVTKQLETVSGLVEQINAKQTGIKVAGEWLNISQYHPLTELPKPGHRVNVQVERTDRGAWIDSAEVLDGGTVHPLTQTRRGGGGGGRSPAELREIRRLTCLKAAAAFGASRPDSGRLSLCLNGWEWRAASRTCGQAWVRRRGAPSFWRAAS